MAYPDIGYAYKVFATEVARAVKYLILGASYGPIRSNAVEQVCRVPRGCQDVGTGANVLAPVPRNWHHKTLDAHLKHVNLRNQRQCLSGQFYRHGAKMKRAEATSLDDLPLFATDDMICAALLGPDRVEEWRMMVSLLEAKGFPKIDERFGGRYLPAVRAYFDHEYGLDGGVAAPLAPDGREDFESWKKKQRERHS